MRIPRPNRSARVWTVALGLALLLHCGGAPDRDHPTASGRPVAVRALMSHDPPSLSLVGKTDINTSRLAVQLTDSLLQFDPELNLRPRVAESWEFSEDRRTLTFHLRSGVRWHDGRPVTARDVVFTVEQVRDPAVESRSWLPMFQDLESVEALDERTVRARYRVATPDVLEAWCVPLIPAHLAESGLELLTGRFAGHPVGCGPFRFVRYTPGEEIVLAANDDYWDGRPFIDRLVLRIYRDQRTAYQLLLAGELDIMAVTSNLWNEARGSPQASRLASFEYYRLSLYQVRWNQDGSNPFFTDARVRRAMLHAVDRETFLEKMLHGMGRVAATSYHPDLPWTDPTIRPVPFDPDQARRLLDEAGWVRPGPGRVRERDGRPFAFTLTIIASTQQIVDQMAAWLQQSWAEVGLSAEIEKLEWGYYRERRRAGQFEAMMDGFSSTPSPDQFELYHSSARETGVNYMSFSDPEVDRLLELGRTTFDPAERRRVYFRLQRRLDELQPIGCLLHFANPVLRDRRLQGVEPSPMDYWKTTRGPRVWRWVDDGS